MHTFKIGVYAPAILPSKSPRTRDFSCSIAYTSITVLAVYGMCSFVVSMIVSNPELCSVSLAMEATGDITASAEVSRLPVDGIEFDSRVQGGILVRAGHLNDTSSAHVTVVE